MLNNISHKDFEFIDLNHNIDENISIFHSIPRPKITSFMSHKESKLTGKYKNCLCELTKIELITSTGTYLDTPFHFNEDGRDISRLDLSQLILDGICLN